MKIINVSYYIAFIASVALVFFIAYLTSESRLQDKYVQIEIVEGETLWEISEEFSNHFDLDQQRFIKWVENKNNINGNTLKAGTNIVIPVKKEMFQESMLLANSSPLSK